MTMRNMPWLDLGVLPVSYSTDKQEAFQVYMVPSNDLPFNVIVEYDEWNMQYDFNRLRGVYDKSHFRQKEISLEDLEDTL